MSFKRLIFILIFLCVTNIHITNCDDDQSETTDLQQPKEATPSEKTGRALFSPRMEYNEWLPVGRGDPLKDPTYDYVPPVLDRVRYWADGASQKDNTDILLLGVPSKKLTNKQKEKTQYGPIRRNYYSQQYVAPTQPRQELPTRLMPPPMFHSDSYQMATQSWQTHNNIYDSRPEHSSNYISVVSPSTIKRKPFLPTALPLLETESTTPQPKPQPNFMNVAMISDGFKLSAPAKHHKKPLLHTILRTETAAPFTKIPSSAYTINYTESIYNPETINSMAAINNVYQPTEPTVRPFSMTTTLPPPAMTTDSMFSHYKQPEQPMRGPMYLIIEGHSKVKTYGLKNDDILERHLPKIRQISNNQDPVVRRIVDETPVEYRVKHLHAPKKDPNKYFKRTDGKNSGAMSNLLTLLDTSFGNFLSNDSEGSDEDTEEIPKAPKSQKNRKGKEVPETHERKTRSLQEPEHQHKRLSVSFQVDDGQTAPQYQLYRKGTVITEKLFPLTYSSR